MYEQRIELYSKRDKAVQMYEQRIQGRHMGLDTVVVHIPSGCVAKINIP